MPLFPVLANTYTKDTGLPPSWEVRWSNSKKLPYYYNPEDKVSKWEAPFGSDPVKLLAHILATCYAGKIVAAHVLVKHVGSRKPKSWRQTTGVTRTREEARRIIEGYERRINGGEIKLWELATTESDCNSYQKGGNL